MAKIKFKAKAIIFDMDGVITDTMPYHFRAWDKIFKEAGLHVTESEVYLREGQPGIRTIKEISEQHGKSLNESKLRGILGKKERLFKRILHRRFIPGARSFLKDLKSRGFDLALVTGTARHEVNRILPKEMLKLFTVIVTGDEVKRGKPHPEPYLIAINKLKRKPSDVVVLENAPFGIHSAKRAKLTCIALETSLPKNYLNDADLVFPSLKALRSKVSFISIRNN